MDNNEISEARFAEIKAIVGRPIDDNYIERLEEETARDNSYIPFLEMASRIDLTTPRQSPQEWLEKLTTTDFTDSKALVSHSCLLVSDNIENFDLFASAENAYAIQSFPGSLHYEHCNGRPHDALVALETSAPHGASCSLPALVLPVGRLLKRLFRKNGSSDWHETEYFLVIDAAVPGHPVWLIYDRIHGDAPDQIIVEPTHCPLIFEGVGHNFDAAQIFPSIHAWIQSYGNVDFAQLEESIKATHITGAVKAKSILVAEAEELLHQ
ncbi:hypothetical protein FGADI_12892 [Fusarium gaditjirri]|uniref:Uncharacterized protein n=1 Tax=Fusarium gaditjirri TaxID=282569 RepID=A0A8H4WNM4_9HYPO|nr:hypothetical protein FGADI_12892 [Fusarium gaditjirri]